MQAFMMEEANRNKELMVFDWERAAQRIKETGAKEASAGLYSDWEYTGGAIWRDGKPVDSDDTYSYYIHLDRTACRPQAARGRNLICVWNSIL